MMAQSRAESTRDTYNYGQYLNQFPPNTIKVIREFERIQKRICRHKMSIMFNEICIYIYICLFYNFIDETGEIFEVCFFQKIPLHEKMLIYFTYLQKLTGLWILSNLTENWKNAIKCSLLAVRIGHLILL